MNTISNDPKNLERSQIKMMLDYLGIPLEDQAGKLPDFRRQLTIFRDTDAEEYEKAFNSVVLHKTTSGTVEKKVGIIEASKIIHERIRDLEMSALSRVENSIQDVERHCKEDIESREKQMEAYQENFVKAISETFSAAVERESKVYNVQAIKVGSADPVAVDGVVHEEFPRICQLGAKRKNILLVGPSGSGKTHLAAQLAKALDLPYSGQSCSAGVSESVFQGWLIPTGDSGKFEYVTSKFIDSYENGGVFLFDEMDNADANVLVFLNQALANDGFFLSIRHENPYVKKHKDFVAIGCANTFGSGADAMYHGRNSLDESTLDRFRVGTVHMDYSEAVEKSLVNKDVYEVCIKIRKVIEQKRLRKIMSTRVMLDASEMYVDCEWSLKDSLKGYFSSWSHEEFLSCGIDNILNFADASNGVEWA